MSETHNIVILGGGFAGIGAAHYILRHMVPALRTALPSPPSYKVVLVSSSSHLLWTVAAPRVLVKPDLIPAERILAPITDGFTSYPAGSFELLHAEATSLDTSARKISLKPGSSSKAPSTLAYGTLIIATGASSDQAIWSARDGHEKTIAAFKNMNEALQRASTILVAGGGPVGVETTGELAFEYRKTKDITLLSGSTKLLPHSRPSLGPTAEQYLNDLGATVKHGLRASSSERNGAGQTVVKLSDGSSITTDVYIDATGLHPNTSFLPGDLLDSRGAVITDPRTLRVPKAGPRVYAIGSVASYSNGKVGDVWDAISPLMSNVTFDLSNGKLGKEKEYSKKKGEILIVPVGRSKGVGVLFGWGLPSMAVWGIKGRNYMIDGLKDERDGAKYKKA